MTQKISRPSSSQSGSAVIFIFMGIVLFAALTYAVTQNMRVSMNASTDKEKFALLNSEVLQFLDAVKTRYTDLTMVQGVDPLDVSFETDLYKRVNGAVMCANTNQNCSSASCKMFAPGSPDGLQPRLFTDIADPDQQTTAIQGLNGTGQIGQLIIDGVGTSAPDLVFRINGVSPEFCNYFNAQQGLTTAYTSATTLVTIGETQATSRGNIFGGCGSATAFDGTDMFAEEATMFRGKRAFCAPARAAAMNARLAITYVVLAR